MIFCRYFQFLHVPQREKTRENYISRFLSHPLYLLALDLFPISSLVAKILLLSLATPRKIWYAQSTFLSDFLWKPKSVGWEPGAVLWPYPLKLSPGSLSCFSEPGLVAGVRKGEVTLELGCTMWAEFSGAWACLDQLSRSKKRGTCKGLQILLVYESSYSTDRSPGLEQKNPKGHGNWCWVSGKQGHDHEFYIKLSLSLLNCMYIIYYELYNIIKYILFLYTPWLSFFYFIWIQLANIYYSSVHWFISCI